MALPATILDPSRYCTGKENFSTFKEEFLLGLQSVGLDKRVLGTQAVHTAEPTSFVLTETLDTAGNVSGAVRTTRAVLSTPLGSDHPTMAEDRTREAKTNLYIMTHVIDAKGLGCDPTKKASENWAIVVAKYGTTSAVEQVMARENLTGLRLVPVYEDPEEYNNHVKAFRAAHLDDSTVKNMFIESIDDDTFLTAAGGIPAHDDLEQTISFLNSTWWVRRRKHLRDMQAALVSTMATNIANAAAVAAPAQRSRTRTRGNRGIGPCSNGNHGPPGNRDAQRHDLAHCWEDGGGDVANRPASYRPRNYLSTHPVANNVAVPNVQVQSAVVTMPQVFILSAEISAGGELAEANFDDSIVMDQMEVDVPDNHSISHMSLEQRISGPLHA
ncbi:hypothetical protein C8J56DRAFT_890117 [Mycena floridula]|nr:hypothetical protein C8J56DRAFT_890117 [Mycena floridula]